MQGARCPGSAMPPLLSQFRITTLSPPWRRCRKREIVASFVARGVAPTRLHKAHGKKVCAATTWVSSSRLPESRNESARRALANQRICETACLRTRTQGRAYPANLAIVAWCTSKVLAIARQLSPRDRHRKATEPFGR